MYLLAGMSFDCLISLLRLHPWFVRDENTFEAWVWPHENILNAQCGHHTLRRTIATDLCWGLRVWCAGEYWLIVRVTAVVIGKLLKLTKFTAHNMWEQICATIESILLEHAQLKKWIIQPKTRGGVSFPQNTGSTWFHTFYCLWSGYSSII